MSDKDTDELLDGVQIEASEPETQEPAQDAPTPPLASGQESEPDKPESDGSDKPTDGAQKAINKQYRLRREAEEREAETKRQLEAAQAELTKAQGADTEPAIPPLPEDPYEEGYAEKVRAREDAIRAHTAWTERQKVYAEQQQAQEREAFMARQTELANRADAYTKRAQELKINGESLQKAGETIAAYGVPDALVETLLADEDGPLITQYLATDIQTLDKLVRANPIEMGQLIEREVRAKAAQLRPKASDAPPPAETLVGGGPGDDILSNHPGVTIE